MSEHIYFCDFFWLQRARRFASSCKWLGGRPRSILPCSPSANAEEQPSELHLDLPSLSAVPPLEELKRQLESESMKRPVFAKALGRSFAKGHNLKQ